MQISVGLTSLALSIAFLFSASASSAEPRMVAFSPFGAKACPSGWREVDQAKGYVIVGTDDARNVGRKFGAPIVDSTPPKHDHAFRTDLAFVRTATSFSEGDTNAVRIIAAPLQAGLSQFVHTVSGRTSVETSGMPYIQYRLCEEIEPWRASLLPADTVQWFNSDTCPKDWEIYRKAIGESLGRSIVPLPSNAQADEAGLEVRNGVDVHRPHVHSANVSLVWTDPDDGGASLNLKGIPELTYSLTGHSINHAGSVTSVQHFASEISTRSDIKGGGISTDRLYPVPFMYLMPCLKISEAKSPEYEPLFGLGFFTTGFYCEDGFQEVELARGRYLVSLPSAEDGGVEPVNGVVFGDPALESGQLPMHRHSLNVDVDLPEITVAAPWLNIFKMSGLQRKDRSEPIRLAGTTEAASLGLPYVQLRFCTVQVSSDESADKDTK